MSGGIITISIGLFDRFSGASIPYIVYIGIILLFVFVACFLAWIDARQEMDRLSSEVAKKEQELLNKVEIMADKNRTILELRQELSEVKEQRTPLFKATILEVATAELSGQGEKQTAITYKITISNLGMPSVVVDWMPFITLAGRKPLAFEYMHFGNELTLGHETDGKATVIKSQDMIYEKTTTPIQTGAMVVGFLHFWSSYKRDDIRAQETNFGVFFKDVNEVIYEVHYDKENSKTLPAPRYTPGVQTRTTTINKSTPRRKKRK